MTSVAMLVGVCPSCGVLFDPSSSDIPCTACGVSYEETGMHFVKLVDDLIVRPWGSAASDRDRRSLIESLLDGPGVWVLWREDGRVVQCYYSSGMAVAAVYDHDRQAWLRSERYSVQAVPRAAEKGCVWDG